MVKKWVGEINLKGNYWRIRWSRQVIPEEESTLLSTENCREIK
jgi:hypothetical protein